MARTIRLTLAYDGTDFRGFARQRGLRTVQGELEGALARILGTVPGLSVAGRTDAGVHARGQVVSFGVPPALLGRVDPARLQRALNGLLAPEVVVVRAAWAPPGFDARRSARAREYRYRIDVGPLPDPFTARYVWHRPGDPSLARMRAAARHLVGEHDFASFCRRPEAGGTVRRLERLYRERWARGGPVRPEPGEGVRLASGADGFWIQSQGRTVAFCRGRLPDDPAKLLAALWRSEVRSVEPEER